MKNRKSVVLVLLTAVVAVSMAFAQPKGHDPAAMVQHHVQRLTTLLSLTPSQQQQATTIFTNAMNSMSTVHGDMKTAHQSLQTAIKNNDQNGISQASTTIGNLTSQMIATHAKAQAAFLQTLNPDQVNKMSELKGEGMGPMGFGGRGHFMH